MLSCSYNGWADVPEDERESLEIYEAAADRPAGVPHAQRRLRKAGKWPWNWSCGR